MSRNVVFQDLHRIPYKKAWDYQEKLFQKVLDAKISGFEVKEQYLLFCEHEHVYTLGKHGDKHNLLITEQRCKARGIDFFPIDRGGDITYHGPGQLVVYPILDMEEFRIGVKQYISMLEDVVINVLRAYGIQADKDKKAMGVWLDPDHPGKARKICAIGVRTSRYVTMHGLALNVNTDLSYFNFIHPCGIVDKGVTSMQKELGREPDFGEVKDKMKACFCEVFGCEMITATPIKDDNTPR